MCTWVASYLYSRLVARSLAVRKLRPTHFDVDGITFKEEHVQMVSVSTQRLLVAALACAFSWSSVAAASVKPPVPRLFAVEVTGKGTPMIFIPGFISSGAVWKGAVAHYSTSHECHVLTLSGFAGEPPSNVTPFLPAVCDGIAAYIREHNFHEPVIVGHSLGGFVALWLAVREPDLVGKLVIVDGLPAPGAEGNTPISPEELNALAETMATGFAKADSTARRRMLATMVTDSRLVETIASWGDASDPASASKALRESMASDLRADVGGIKSPTLVLGSGASPDSAEVERNFRGQFENMKSWRLEIDWRARHFIMYDDPEWMFEKMDAFLGR